MQMVIDIDETIFKRTRYEYYGENEVNHSLVNEILISVINGTVLPKGHGRLIDADYLREDFKASKKISFAERMDISCIVDHAPTIIEADKGANDDNN